MEEHLNADTDNTPVVQVSSYDQRQRDLQIVPEDDQLELMHQEKQTPNISEKKKSKKVKTKVDKTAKKNLKKASRKKAQKELPTASTSSQDSMSVDSINNVFLPEKIAEV